MWSLTVTVDKVAADPRIAAINQTPTDNPGACQIDWLKIEKGNTRTPNISEYKYFGEGLKDSNNPNDYSWDITPEYTEKGLNDSVSLTEPQDVAIKQENTALKEKADSLAQINSKTMLASLQNSKDVEEIKEQLNPASKGGE